MLIIDLLASLIFTWGLGLLFPLILRYKISKKPLKKRYAIPLAITGLIIHSMLSIAIKEAAGMEGRAGSALGVVALVGYYIMTKKRQKR